MIKKMDSFTKYLAVRYYQWVFSLAARSYEALSSEEGKWVLVCRYTYVWYNTADSGWRIYMEDAHIDAPALESDKKNSLFAVFDGHGGTKNAI